MFSDGGTKPWRPRRLAVFALVSLLSLIIICISMRDRLLYAAALVATYTTAYPLGRLDALNLRSYNGMARLRFKADGSFKIAVFEDLHFGEAPSQGWGVEADKKSMGVIESILAAEQPDFAVLNGDLITGEDTFLENSTHYFDQIAAPLASRRIPWASTYGNHDNQFNLSSFRLLERELSQYPDLSYTRAMISSDVAGTSNYVLPIFSSDIDIQVPVVLLWFFDSKGGSKFQEEDPNGTTPDERRVPIADVVDPSVVDWFLQTNTDLIVQYGQSVPSLVFVHIPVYAMAAFQSTGIDPSREPGINDDIPLSPQSMKSGEYTALDVPFMKALVDVGVSAVFSGHDHGDDWCFKWDGLLPNMTVSGAGLFSCFGRHTGYGGYGSWMRGSRQVSLVEGTIQDEIATWIRLEDGDISGSVVLNSTFGTDLYPPVKNTHSRPQSNPG